MTIKNALKQLSSSKSMDDDTPNAIVPAPLDRQEIVDLIDIRQYVVNATANPAIDRATVNYLNGSLLMIDKKIIGLLQSSAFKEYINYNDVGKAIQEVRTLTDIKSSLKK